MIDKKLFVVLAVAMLMFSMTIATASATTEVKDLNKNTGVTIDFKEKKISSFKVTWNANGGKIASKKTRLTNVKKGSKVGKLTTPKRAGYTFDGWYTKRTGGTKINANTKPTKSITYIAQWALTIKWDANSGKIGSKKTIPTKAKENTKVGKFPKTPKSPKKGYIFKGWFTKKIGGTQITTSTKPSKSITYYAQWTKAAKLTIKWNANGGKVNSKNSVLSTVAKGSKIGELPPTPKRSGYIFKGWFNKPKGGTPINVNNKPTSTKNDVYAQWEKGDDLAPLVTDDDDLAPLVSNNKTIKARHLGKWTCVEEDSRGKFISTITINQGSCTENIEQYHKDGDKFFRQTKDEFSVDRIVDNPLKFKKFFVPYASTHYDFEMDYTNPYNAKTRSRDISRWGTDTGWSSWDDDSPFTGFLFYWETNTGMESLNLNGHKFYKNLVIVKK